MNVWLCIALIALAFLGGCATGYATHAKDCEELGKTDKPEFYRGGLEKQAKYQFIQNNSGTTDFNSQNFNHPF